MDGSQRFKLIYSKMQEVLDDDVRNKAEPNGVEFRNSAEDSLEELDEIAKLREIVLEMSAPEPISFTTT